MKIKKYLYHFTTVLYSLAGVALAIISFSTGDSKCKLLVQWCPNDHYSMTYASFIFGVLAFVFLSISFKRIFLSIRLKDKEHIKLSDFATREELE